MSTIPMILGSVRAGRICPVVAEWVAGQGRTAGGLVPELLDLKDWPLPMDDEPGVPAHGAPLRQPHSRAWSEFIAAAPGFVIVTPQYNWGYPAALKNALDHLYEEWNGKPVLIVTYGGHGGTKAAVQLRQVAEGLKMRPTVTAPALTLPKSVIAEEAPLDAASAFADQAEAVRRGFAELSAMLAEA